MVQATKNRLRHDLQVLRKLVPVHVQSNREGRGRLRDAWPQGHVGAACIIMCNPCVQQESARNEHSCHSRQSRVFPLSGCVINLRFEHLVFHPMICYFKVLFACATSRATINVPPDLCYERFWHRPFG